MSFLSECCPPGYEDAKLNDRGEWICFYRERDFFELVGVGLSRFVDPTKPPVPSACVGGPFDFERRDDVASIIPPQPTGTVRLGTQRTAGSRINLDRGQIITNGLPFTGDAPTGSEPPTGDQTVPGLLDQELFGTGITGEDILGVLKGFIGGGNGGNGGSPATDLVPSTQGECPGMFSVRVGDQCINLGDLAPGGDPAITGQTGMNGMKAANGFGQAVKGRFGVGIVPRVDVQTVRRCPAGMALGKDGVCYDGLGRNSPKRQWPMGMKPLLTPGERRAIRVAESAARKLKGSKKALRKASRALEKAC